MSKATLQSSLKQPGFVDIQSLQRDGVPSDTDLLVFPYGSAFPAACWPQISAYVHRGGNLLVIGGQPFRVPVDSDGRKFSFREPQDRYAREVGILHTYEAPQHDAAGFEWRNGYEFWPKIQLNPEHSFVLESRHLDGLAYLVDSAGQKIAAPVVFENHIGSIAGEGAGSRYVFLDFQPAPGYWDSTHGKSLIGTAADYARSGAMLFQVEVLFSTIRPGETPLLSAHVQFPETAHVSASGSIDIDLSSNGKILTAKHVTTPGGNFDADVSLPNSLEPGFYVVRSRYRDESGRQEAYENGFWVEDAAQVNRGPDLGVRGDILTENGKPFFPAGTNYFSTESNGWDFAGARNASVWEHDFAEMESHGVTFVRTGVWGGHFKVTEPIRGVTERFLRNLEAYLLSAQRHHIAVNFTFFAFDPQTTMRLGESNPIMFLPGTNPYLDPVTIQAERSYMLSIVNRFKDVPYLCWDLINEPSFSNPHALWHGNTPNGDPAEQHAWHEWLKNKYGTVDQLAQAWSVAPDQLSAFDSVPLPSQHDLAADLENGGAGMVRALDYNLFAQDSFSDWVKGMVGALHSVGSHQLIDVGQDEGGVESRVLNQFFAHAGLSFTTNHTYRQNEDLLWDSFASKAPGVANIVGETGYQPVTYPNGDWRFDEITGYSLIESKWAAGFASGTTGFLSWDWDRELYFGIERADGSAKTWMNLMRDMGEFAKQAAPYATAVTLPEVAIVLPQSLQLSVFNRLSIEAQQKSFRALYGYARSQAYAVGEDQLQYLGHPKLIIVPSPWILDSGSWETLIKAAQAGSTLLITGPFDQDPHFLHTDRAAQIGVRYKPHFLSQMLDAFDWPGGSATLTFSNETTDFLQRAVVADEHTFVEKQIGAGKLLFATMPLELNDNLQAIGDVYRYALKVAGINPVYTTALADTGVLICPTVFPDATLYVIASQTDRPDEGISFRDERSQKTITGRLAPGRSALLLVSDRGQIVASYNWPR